MKARTPATQAGGFSLTEMVVTVAIMGILSAVAVVSFSNTKQGTGDAVAKELVETLNLGLKKFSQINYEFSLAAADAASTDEFLVLRSLQWRDPLDPSPGAPYVRPNFNPVASSSLDDYRVRWNGRVFTLVPPKTAGTGLKVDFQAGDYGANYTFPTGYAPTP